MRRHSKIPDDNPQGELLMELRRLVDAEFNSDKKAAEHLGYSPAYMSAILIGKKPVPEKIAKILGYELRWVKTSNAD